ncbi:hypothetical protein [Hydrogenophaga sp. PAMC20947]|uniref:hypothetical protein n=1 Tax=Hydrogenophaga sp. PAMC20947 TaxID=2565558 RepID=UPI00109DCE8D|nr:hypothetical protein [Hydrogenophaga sp. PAMC20947]QCB48291.1 hypothetical protein E5678_21030 [Hydrogenophaga sp. PAMC20947]
MLATLTRLVLNTFQPGAKSRKVASLRDLQGIRSALLQSIEDCESLQTERLRHKISGAKNAQELWLLRNDAYQIISHHHSQSAAVTRINGLRNVFEGWLEPRHLAKIK